MLGAIIGDIIGSTFEHYPIKTKDFELFRPGSRFTDDTVMTIAVADALLSDMNFAKYLERYYYHYPNLPYGGMFHDWARANVQKPYNSWGNGSAMRVSPAAYAGNSIDDVLDIALKTAEVTHNHPEGIKGAQATALVIFLALKGKCNTELIKEITTRFEYDLDRRLVDLRPDYFCDLSCQNTVPEAIICFLEADSYEDAIRNAISLGGDADTMACIAGSFAEARWGIPEDIKEKAYTYLDDRIINVLERFYKTFVSES